MPIIKQVLQSSIIRTLIKSGRRVLFSWELHCLVALFILFYVMCASVTTEGTDQSKNRRGSVAQLEISQYSPLTGISRACMHKKRILHRKNIDKKE